MGAGGLARLGGVKKRESHDLQGWTIRVSIKDIRSTQIE